MHTDAVLIKARRRREKMATRPGPKVQTALLRLLSAMQCQCVRPCRGRLHQHTFRPEARCLRLWSALSSALDFFATAVSGGFESLRRVMPRLARHQPDPPDPLTLAVWIAGAPRPKHAPRHRATSDKRPFRRQNLLSGLRSAVSTELLSVFPSRCRCSWDRLARQLSFNLRWLCDPQL